MSCFVKQIKQNIWNKKKYNNKKAPWFVQVDLMNVMLWLVMTVEECNKNVTSCYNRVKCKWFMKVLQCILIIYYNGRFNFELCIWYFFGPTYYLYQYLPCVCFRFGSEKSGFKTPSFSSQAISEFSSGLSSGRLPKKKH